MLTSDNYQDSLILALKDPIHAAAYIDAILEEKDPEPELLKHALQDVAEALGEGIISGEQAKLHLDKLNHFLSVEGSREIYLLGVWLNALGLKLTVTVKN
jgi:Predicted transcriptional regulator